MNPWTKPSRVSESSDHEIDVGIITVIPNEIQAFFKVFNVDPNIVSKVSRPYEYWELILPSRAFGHPLRIMMTFLSGPAGNTESAATTAFFLRDWRPRLMCLVGIAAGVPGKARIGDVVFPDKVIDVCIKVMLADGPRPRDDMRYRDTRIDRMLKLSPPDESTFNHAIAGFHGTSLAEIEATARKLGLNDKEYRNSFRILDGSILSGNNLLRDKGYLPEVNFIKDERCRGGEMEAGGFARACILDGIPWLIARGISDFGDERKDDSFQTLAATNACLGLYQLLTTNLNIWEIPRAGSLRDTLLATNIVEELTNAYEAGRWKQVVQIGEFLSRPLWLAGRYQLRRQIGQMVENAAARAQMKKERARALIDDLGWTSFVMGDESAAISYLNDGLLLSPKKEKYLRAKALRHLASISRRRKYFSETEKILDKAGRMAKQIQSPEEKSEMENSLLSSRAQLFIETGKIDDGLMLLEAAEKTYRDNEDFWRASKLPSLIARALMKRGDVGDAEKAFRRGFADAKSVGRRDEVFQNASGLCELLRATKEAEERMIWLREASASAHALGRIDDAAAYYQELAGLEIDARKSDSSETLTKGGKA